MLEGKESNCSELGEVKKRKKERWKDRPELCIGLEMANPYCVEKNFSICLRQSSTIR